MNKIINNNTFPINISDELKSSFSSYSTNVILNRAIPDIRDGLKPVHRRILYAMFTENLLFNKKFSKCAGIVGEVLKKYHPHGDLSVYEALVRMAQPWNMREPLISSQGNFGNIDGDSPAAYRYTEAKLSKLAEELLCDISEKTVNFMPNYDNNSEEPSILPSRIPNFVINGSEGIAVAIATKCPPHNLNEVINAIIFIINSKLKKFKITPKKINKIIKGPDFPTGGIIYGKNGIINAQKTGRGLITIRGKAEIIKKEKNKHQILITEIPYQVNKTKLLENIGLLIKEKKIKNIKNLRDESDRSGLCIALDLKKKSVSKITLNQLYKLSYLQISYSINTIAIVKGKPKTLSLIMMIKSFLSFRKEIVLRRSKNKLKTFQRKFQKSVGLIAAISNIEKIIKIIKNSKTINESKLKLQNIKILNMKKNLSPFNYKTTQTQKWKNQKNFSLSNLQINSILEMQLSQLSRLQKKKLNNEAEIFFKKINNLKKIISNKKNLMNLIKKELIEIKQKHSNPRKTLISPESNFINEKDMIINENVLITISCEGYIKRTSLKNYKEQKYGGRGKKATKTKKKDFLRNAFIANTHSCLLIFTNYGILFWIKVYKLPNLEPDSKGKHISNLINLKKNERIKAILPIISFPKEKNHSFIIFGTKNGKIKKTDLFLYSRSRSSGLIGCGIKHNDELISANITNGNNDILISTKNGMSIRFSEKEIRAISRKAFGVIGISLKKNDEAVSMEILNEKNSSILTVTEHGFGKRTKINEYKKQTRGGFGTISIKTGNNNEKVADTAQVAGEDNVIIITNDGKLIQINSASVSVYKKNTKGIKLIKLDKNIKNKVQSVLKITKTI
jgi:DNA gyrase subunit A